MRTVALLAALVCAGGLSAAPQQEARPTPQPGEVTRKDPDAIYGRIKEVKDKQKIVIAVDNAPDKTYNLADAKTNVTLADALAVGDPVKVLETERDGRKSVQIARDTAHQERARKRQDTDKK